MDFKRKEFDFGSYKAFFAFWNDQLEEAMKRLNIWEDEKLVNLWWGLIGLKSNYKEMMTNLNKHYASERARRIKEVGIDWIIKYELSNYESYYTGSIDGAFEVLEEYGCTYDQVLAVYNKEKEFNLDY